MFNLSAWLVAPKPDFSSSSKTFTAIWRRIQWSASKAKEHGIASCEIKLGSTFKPIPCLNSIKGKTWFHQPALAFSSMLIRPDTNDVGKSARGRQNSEFLPGKSLANRIAYLFSETTSPIGQSPCWRHRMTLAQNQGLK